MCVGGVFSRTTDQENVKDYKSKEEKKQRKKDSNQILQEKPRRQIHVFFIRRNAGWDLER